MTILDKALDELGELSPDEIAAFMYENGIFDPVGGYHSAYFLNEVNVLAYWLESLTGDPVCATLTMCWSKGKSPLDADYSYNPPSVRAFMQNVSGGCYPWLKWDHEWNEDLVGDTD